MDNRITLLETSDAAVPLNLLTQAELDTWKSTQTPAYIAWIEALGFTGGAGQWCLLPDDNGRPHAYLAGIEAGAARWALAELATTLPPGDYQLTGSYSDSLLAQFGLGWALAQYRFERFKSKPSAEAPRLVVGRAYAEVVPQIEALYRVRDLINMPPNEMMPEHLAQATAALAEQYTAEFSEIVGEDLLAQGYPTIHAVGRASSHAPRLLELRWGQPGRPRVILVGKGVCFDSGGLDLKPAKSMRLMQKDMGGAAHVLGLAELIMSHTLPVELVVLIPAVENAVSGNAFRPGDVLKTRQGLTVEVDNTDAEGRLVLCDALTRAGELEPDLIIDFATLTGAARVAVGTEIACFFCNNPTLAASVQGCASDTEDPAWQLPLHAPYERLLKSEFADTLNAAASPYAGAITAGLYLQRFVPDTVDWLHFDVMAWNVASRPGHPKGGEAMGLRAMLGVLQARYAATTG